MKDKNFTFGDRIFTVRSENSLSDARIGLASDENGVREYEICFSFASENTPCDVCIFWREPIEGVTGYWSPVNNRDRYIPQGWYAQRAYSALADGAPVFSLFNADSVNFRTFALSESELPFETALWLENIPCGDKLRVEVFPFKNDLPRRKEYTFYLRIDERRLPMADCICGVSRWWSGFYPPDERICSADSSGELPLFSSWYACMQEPRQEDLERELPLLARLGFRSLIIDDGWSYDRHNDAYSRCGTWEISRKKFPDIRGFLEKAHILGIRVALWFPVPFVGTANPDFEKFRDKMLGVRMSAGILDPRYPETREYIVGSYENIIRKYGFDGLKLDFINEFNRPAAEAHGGTDCVTINDGITAILSAVEKRLRRVNPGMLIEYRESYIGPSVIRGCNMLRVSDCAFDFITNRLGVINLRMLAYPVAIHSDMLLWGLDEKPENIAVMLENILFSVPQISVLPSLMNEKQNAVLSAYLAYWTPRREILLHGRMTVFDPHLNYTLAWAENDVLKIAVLYAQRVFSFDGKDTDLFNACDSAAVFVDSPVPAAAVVTDIYGKNTAAMTLPRGAAKIPVPKGGRVSLRRLPD